MIQKFALTLAVAALCSPFAVRAEKHMSRSCEKPNRAVGQETIDQSRFRTMVHEASEAYSSIAKGAHGKVPTNVLNNALCIGVLPGVMTGAFVVGGTHGEGLVSCKVKDNSWSAPATISLNQGSIGLQAGAKSVDVVLFFQTKQAVEALKKGHFAIGTDVSAVAGTYDSNISTAAAGVIVYAHSEGLFAGASVNGGMVGKEQEKLERFYGEKIDYTALLDGSQIPESTGCSYRLTKLFP
jgi:lipid-binding SYLF domain-containing protein